MSSSLETPLFRATALTFEGLGFVLVSSVVEEDTPSAAAEAAVEVTFRGPFTGRIVLSVYGCILREVVSNMLGEETVSESSLEDALGELANVICGNVLPQIAGGTATFSLDHPVVLSRTEWEEASGRPLAQVHVGVEQGAARVRLYVDGDVALPLEERAA